MSNDLMNFLRGIKNPRGHRDPISPSVKSEPSASRDIHVADRDGKFDIDEIGFGGRFPVTQRERDIYERDH